MTLSLALTGEARWRTMYFLGHPAEWPLWPFLPLVRRKPGVAEEELGVIFDALHCRGLAGLSCTVFLANLVLLPPQFEQFLALPHETFDTPEEVTEAGWAVD
jgi:hypothetical protein